jgi:hypothetical protein
MFISDTTISDSAAASSPLTYRTNLYFHSGLPYVQIKQEISAGNITFAAQPRGITEWSDGSKGCGGLC